MSEKYDLSAIFDEHVADEFVAKDVAATMSTMTAEPFVNHVPTMMGGVGGRGVADFYDKYFVGHWPDDTEIIPVSRTVDKPGTNVAAKSGLNRAILAKGWHQFDLALHSAARYTGTTVVKVSAAYTSQRRSVCGRVDPKSRESQAVFRCTTCAHNEDADVNAARNVLAAGLAVTACQDQPQPAGWARSPKQEPAGNREELLLQPHTPAA